MSGLMDERKRLINIREAVGPEVVIDLDVGYVLGHGDFGLDADHEHFLVIRAVGAVG